MTCGLYEFWCGPYFYQGSSKNIELRWSQHQHALSKGTHDNPKVQNAYNRYGWTGSSIIVECEDNVLFAWEQAYIDANWGSKHFLNCHPVARGGGIRGREITQKHRDSWSAGQRERFKKPGERQKSSQQQKIAQNREEVRNAHKASMRALWQDPSYRERMVQAHLGYKRTPEAVAKTAEAHRGKKRSEETKARISASLRGKKRAEETKEKMRAANKGRKFGPMTEEHKAKIGAANRGKKPSEETKAKLSALNKGKKQSEETKAKLSALNKGVPWSEARRAAYETKKAQSS